MTENTAVVAPMATASVSTATVEKPGACQNCRTALRRSCSMRLRRLDRDYQAVRLGGIPRLSAEANRESLVPSHESRVASACLRPVTRDQDVNRVFRLS